jgi:hypothetical protein
LTSADWAGLPIDDSIADWRLAIGDWLPDNHKSLIAQSNPQSSIQSSITNQQSVNRQSAVGSRYAP